MVRPERFELPTCCSGGNRSIQLSYGRARCLQSTWGRETASTSPCSVIRKKAEDHRRRITKAVADKQQLLARQYCRE